MKKVNTAHEVSRRTRRLTESAMIAALYTAATLLLAPASFGQIQLRAAEALTLLPALTPSAVIGLTVGCAISNGVGVAMGANICGVADIFFGSAATLLAAIASRMLRKVTFRKMPVLSALPPVIFNGLIKAIDNFD
ncbi:MAG: QueT transporter family protein, partial [Clostridia bacterium]|nr:QueT transporter family protein [Clostridia bacterium]